MLTGWLGDGKMFTEDMLEETIATWIHSADWSEWLTTVE